MAIAHARRFTAQFEIIGEATMHTSEWEENIGYGEGGVSADGEKVTVMRDKDGTLHVVPSGEIDYLFQVVP